MTRGPQMLAGLVGVLIPIGIVVGCTVGGWLPPIAFGATFLLWVIATLASRSRSEEGLQLWGYAIVIPGAIAAGLWTLLDLWRSVNGTSTLAWLPKAELFLWSGFWVLFPPIFFFLEFQVLWRTCDKDDAIFDRLKHQQHLAAAVWLAIVTVIGGASVRDWVKDLRGESATKTLEKRVETLENKLNAPKPPAKKSP